MFTQDPNIFNPQSEVSERMQFYTSVFDELHFIVFNAWGRSESRGKVHIYSTTRITPYSLLKSLFVGWRILRRRNIDIITSQSPFIIGLIAYLLKKLTRAEIPLQMQLHTGLLAPYFGAESLKNRIYVLLAKFLLPRADCIKVVSEGMRKYLTQELKISPSKISVLPVYISFEEFERDEIKTNLHAKYPQFDFIALMASRIVKQKNISLAIRSLYRLVQKYSKIGLLVVGSGPGLEKDEEMNLKLLTKNLKLEDNVRFEPWTRDIASYYKTADLLLLTSNYEGWARTILEAMAAGLPSVTTGVYFGITGEIVESGKNGVVVPVGDEDALTAAIEDLYLNTQKRKAMGEAGRKTIKNLQWRDKSKYLELYKKTFSPCKRGL